MSRLSESGFFKNQVDEETEDFVFEETEEEFEDEFDSDSDSDDDETEDIFDEEEAEEETESVNVAVDELKLRRANIVSGEEALVESDFKDSKGNWKGNGQADWENYQQMTNLFETMSAQYKPEDKADFLSKQFKSLVYGKYAPFKKYLPGSRAKSTRTRKAAETVTLIEHQAYLDAKRAVEESVAKFLEASQEVKAFNELFSELIPENAELIEQDKDGNEKRTKVELPVFTLYCSGSNPVVNWIKQNYEPIKEQK